MRNLVGETDPGATRGERMCGRREPSLVARVEFHRIMQFQHVVVVLRADALRHANRGQEFTFTGQRGAKLRPELPCDTSEWLTELPHSCPTLRIDVRKNAEDAFSATRLAGKAVHVQPGIIFSPGLLAARNFHWPKAGFRLVESWLVRGNKVR